jgi:hypothetical protein
MLKFFRLLSLLLLAFVPSTSAQVKGNCYNIAKIKVVDGKITEIECIGTPIKVGVTLAECANQPCGLCWRPTRRRALTTVSSDELTPGNPCTDDGECSVCDPDMEGEPHLKTWAGERFDYHGECDLVLLHAPALDLTVHVRTTIRYDYSYISSAVVQLGQDQLEVGGWGSAFWNGVAIPGMELNLLTKHIHYSTPDNSSNKVHKFEIVLNLGEDATSQYLVVKTFKDWVSVVVYGHDEEHFGNSVGLFGSFTTGKKLGRDGVTVFDDPIEFGNEWQVLDSEPMLFQSTRAPQYPQACKLPSMTTQQRRLLEGTVSLDEAEEACGLWENKAKKEQCVFDVMASGDIEVAQAGAF